LTVSEAVARAAWYARRVVARTRGWTAPASATIGGGRNIVVRRAADGRMEVEVVTRGEPPAELARIARSKIEDLDREVSEERGGAAKPAGAAPESAGEAGEKTHV
jgi:hypothetical protein